MWFTCGGFTFWIHEVENSYTTKVLGQWFVADDLETLIDQLTVFVYNILSEAKEGAE